MEMYLATFNPFSKLTDALSSSCNVSISNVHPMLIHIEKECKTAITIDVTDECRHISKEVQSALWTYISTR